MPLSKALYLDPVDSLPVQYREFNWRTKLVTSQNEYVTEIEIAVQREWITNAILFNPSIIHVSVTWLYLDWMPNVGGGGGGSHRFVWSFFFAVGKLVKKSDGKKMTYKPMTFLPVFRRQKKRHTNL